MVRPLEVPRLLWDDAQVRVAPWTYASDRPLLLRLLMIFMSSPRPVQVALTLITGPCRRHAMMFQASEAAAIAAPAIAMLRATQSVCISPCASPLNSYHRSSGRLTLLFLSEPRLDELPGAP